MTTKPAQFTPGPWVVDEDYEDEEQQAIGIVKEGRGYIAGIHILASCNNGEGFTAEDRANAHLIAAAPAMYEALKALVDVFPSVVKMTPYGVSMDISKLHDNAKAALSQAEGR